MLSVPPGVCLLVAAGTTAALVGCSSADDASSSAPTTPSSPSSALVRDDALLDYVKAVDQLCDALLPQVVDATHGGSIDIPAAQYLHDWPAHERLLEGFDHAWSVIPVPPSAQDAAHVMSGYIAYADALDQARLAAARAGERPWRREVSREEGGRPDPSIAARNAAGFHETCDAR